MADFTALKTAIQTYIKQNGNEEITGAILQEILLSVVTTLGDGAINDLVSALANEVAARQNADGTLQQNINNEATTRGNADTTLGGRIDDEAAARANGDTALSNRLGSSITAQNTAADQIGAEAEARATADTALQGLIDGITNNIENGYVYAGIATPSSTPTTGKVFYLALTAGTYTNFGSTVVSQGVNILKYNGSAWSLDAFIGIDDTPTPNSQKLVKSGGAFDSVMTNGSAFDISAHFASGGTLATYADLNAALTALNALPAAFKQPGMSFKFVLTSDNKYVQFRYMISSTAVADFTNVANWQGVDDEPTAGSDNLIKSSGVVNYVGQIASESTASSNYNLLTNLYIKSGEEFYAKVTRANEGSERVIICYNGSNSNRLIDSDADDSFIGNFVELTAPEDITQLGVYIGASGNSFVLEISSKIDAKVHTNKVAIDELNTETSILHSEVFSEVNLNNESLWEIGEYNSSTGEKGTNPNRIRTKEYIKISPYTTVEITPLSNDVTTRLIVFAYDENYNFLGYKARTSGNMAISEVLADFPNAVYYNINAYDNNGSALSSVSEAFTLFSLNTIDICDAQTDYLNKTFENGSINLADAWKFGEISATTGQDMITGVRLCTRFYYRFEDDARTEIIPNQSFDVVQVIKYIYDRNQNYLGYFSAGQPFSNIRTTYPTAYWVRLSIRRFRNAGTEVTQDVEFLKNIIWHGFTEVYLLNRIENNNILYGKKWVACGDSFTHGDFTYSVTPETSYTIQDGRYAGELKVYPYIIGNRNDMVIVNEAVNGSTMTYRSDVSNAFSDTRYQNIDDDADYITLKFGINDDVYHKDMPLGTIDDETNTTFYGAYNKVLKYIITHHLDAKIGVIVTNGSTEEIANATIAIAKKWGIPYLNEATDENCPFVFRSNRANLDSYIANERRKHWVVSNVSGSGNAHPNEFAHEFESTVIENWLRSL